MTNKTKLEFGVGRDHRVKIDALPSQLNPLFKQWLSLANAVERIMDLGEKRLVWKLTFRRAFRKTARYNFFETKCELQTRNGQLISSFDQIRIFKDYITDHRDKIKPYLFASRIAQELSCVKTE